MGFCNPESASGMQKEERGRKRIAKRLWEMSQFRNLKSASGMRKEESER